MNNETDDFVHYGNLLEAYGALLTDKQRAYMEMYFQSNFSLSEIAEELNISRSAVHNQIQSSIKKMESFEKSLHIAYIQDTFVYRMQEALDEQNLESAKEVFAELIKTIDGR